MNDERKLEFHSFVCIYMWLMAIVGPIRIIYLIYRTASYFQKADFGSIIGSGITILIELIIWILAIIVVKGLEKRMFSAWKCLMWRQSILLLYNVIYLGLILYIISIGVEFSYNESSSISRFLGPRILWGFVVLIYYWRRKPLFQNKCVQVNNKTQEPTENHSADYYTSFIYDTNTEKCSHTSIPSRKSKGLLALPLLLGIIALISIIGNIYLGYQNTKLNKDLTATESILSSLDKNYDKLNEAYQSNISGSDNSKSSLKEDEADRLQFFDKKIVVIGTDEKYYHKLGCKYLDMSDYWLFNVEYAEAKGFEACPLCN